MNSLIKCLLIFSSCINSGFALAEIRLGPKLGVNISYMKWKPFGNDVTIEAQPVEYFGVVSELELNENVFLQQGLFLSKKGAVYNDGIHKLTLKPVFLELPINLVQKFNFFKTKLFIFFGPYFAFGMTGSYQYSNWENEVLIKYGSGNEYDMKELDAGVNFGLGVEYAHFQFTCQNSLGISNLAPVNENGEVMRNRLVNFSMAYLFGEKKK